MYNKIIVFFATLSCFISLTIGGAAWYGYKLFYIASATTYSSLFIVSPGDNLTIVAKRLKAEKLINSAPRFRLAAILLGYRTKLRSGEYRIPAHASMADILFNLVDGKVFEHSFTIAEGLTVEQVMQRLAIEPSLTGKLPLPLPKEGSLLTNTLKFLRGQTRISLIKRFVDQQHKLVMSIWQHRDKNIPLKTYNELIIMASIIEKESSLDNERPIIAAVFYNRLKSRMRLQADSTVIYGRYGGIGKPTGLPIYSSDLLNDNPYNTYKIFGLPPSAIANPGHKALLAAAHPANSGYLYFVGDGTGKHVFSTNLQDHNLVVKKLRLYERAKTAKHNS